MSAIRVMRPAVDATEYWSLCFRYSCTPGVNRLDLAAGDLRLDQLL